MNKILFLIFLLLFSCSKKNATKTDTIPPTVNISNITNGDNVWGSIIIDVTASDESGIASVEFYGNDTIRSTDTSSPYSYTLDISQYTEGSQVNLFVKAMDNSGNIRYSDTLILNVTQTATSFHSRIDTIGARYIKIHWDKYTAAGFLRYLVCYSTFPDVDTLDNIFETIYSVNDTNSEITGLIPLSQYYIRVFVLKSDRTLFPSNELNATTLNDTIRNDGAEMVLVESGDFTMGDVWGHGGSDEIPSHIIYLNSFYIDKYEVTNERYNRFINDGGYSNPEYWSPDGWQWRNRYNITTPQWWGTGQYNSGMDYPQYPVVGISYYEAEAYALWAGKKLPTEAQWEKVARGIGGIDMDGDSIPDGFQWPWGESFHADIGGIFVHCNYNGNDGYTDGFTELAPVGSFLTGVSSYGAMDLAGNVSEWIYDWYASGYYIASPINNPTGPDTGTEKSVRGGSWINSSTTDAIGYQFRTTARSKREPDDRKHYIGFRCVKEAK